MKIFYEKLAMAVNVFTPIVMLLLVFSAYLFIPAKGQRDESTIEMKQVIVKKKQFPVMKSPIEIKKVFKQ
jgi:hypothetical protein